MKSRILYTKPSITELEVQYVTDAARNGWGERCYEYITRFEEMFAKYVGAKYALATSSATGALHLGMAASNIGTGDEVILADTNWVASVAPIVHLGARPVFVDILPDTWCLDPERVERAITPRTKAILATHLYGNLCEMDHLMDIGRRHGVRVIEDAAEALGSRYHSSLAGTMGLFGAFSFHGTKTLTTGEGGMFITNDEALYKRVLTLNNHGRAAGESKQFWAECVGYKYKMSNLQAALGCAQMERIDELISKKREIFSYYAADLETIRGISMNPEKKGTYNSYWMPTAVFASEMKVTREKILERFKQENIDGRVFFWPLSSLPMFTAVPENMNSYSIPERAINIPSYYDLTVREQDVVLNILKEICGM